MNKLIMDKKVVNIIDDCHDIKYDIKDNEELIINYFNHHNKSININISQYNNSKVVVNYSALNEDDTNIDINSITYGNNNKLVINVRVLALDKHVNVNVKSKVIEKTNNNEIIEDLKGLSENGTITLMPILEIDTNEVNANHFATVGSYDEKQLFYLESKGISDTMAKSLIKKSFIYSLFSEDFISMIDDRKE